MRVCFELDFCAAWAKEGLVPVLWIFKKFMFPLADITNRNRRPRGLELFLYAYNSLLINMHVFVIILDFQRSESLDQELLAGDRCGLGASHDVNYQVSDRRREDGFDGRRKRNKDGGVWSRRGCWTMWDKVACLAYRGVQPQHATFRFRTPATPSSVANNKHDELDLRTRRGTQYLLFVSIHSIF
jgi:hypothetical protein